MRIALALLAGAFVSSPVAAHDGWGIVVDRAGRVYFADIPTNSIWRIVPGQRAQRWLSGVHSHALALDSISHVYGTNVHFTEPIRSLWRRGPDGPMEHVIAPTRELPMNFQSFLLGPDGSLYSPNAYEPHVPPERRELLLLRRDPNGEISILAGGPRGHADGTSEAARFESIDGMVWARDSVMLVADGPYLRLISLNGSVRTIGGRALTRARFDEDLAGVAVNAAGAMFVADYATRVVHVVSGAGATNTVWGSALIWSPTGVAFSPHNEMYVLEHLRMPLAVLGNLGVGPYMQVWRIAYDGSRIRLARIWGRNSWVLAVIVGLLLAIPLAIQARRRRSYVRTSSA